MKRHASLITALAMALQATGSAFAAANRLTLVNYGGSMTNVSFDYDDADRKTEMIDGTGTTGGVRVGVFPAFFLWVAMSLRRSFGRCSLLGGRSLTMGMRVGGGCKVSSPSSVTPRITAMEVASMVTPPRPHTYFVRAGESELWVHNAPCRFKPDPTAVGPHTTFRRGVGGKITGYQEWWPNPKNPTGFQRGKRFREPGDHTQAWIRH